MSDEQVKPSETEEQVTTGETPADVTPEGEKPTEENKPEANFEKLQRELSEAQRRISELNAESAERRVKLKEFEEAEEQRRRERMTELEKAQADAEDWKKKHDSVAADWEGRYQQLEAQFQQYRISHEVERAANELGFVHPQDALALIDLGDLTIEDDGKVSGFEEKLKALAESGRLPMRNEKPGVGTPQRADGRQTGGSAKKQAREETYKQFAGRFNF